MSSATESAVRDYLKALKDPALLRDEGLIENLSKQLKESDDPVERLRIRQHLLDAQEVPVERYEDAFVTHAKAWASEHGVGVKAFSDEGVPSAVLGRAGFAVRGRRRATTTRTRRRRVTTDEVRAAVPSRAFTIKDLQDASGASTAVVRKVVVEEEAAGRLRNEGADPNHRGPGRAPVLYLRT